MSLSLLVLSSVLSVIACAQPTRLFASHFSGHIYTLSFSSESSSLTIISEIKAGGIWPSWLLLDPDAGTLYVTDENSWSNPILTSLQVENNGTLSPIATVASKNGGDVHSTFYGGADGKGFIAVAQ